ncbi:MAG: hypothetical protein AB1521_17630 [Bacteroidota bacterium]
MKKGVFFLLIYLSLNLDFSNAQATKPYQFIAKIYTEAMGVIPPPDAWNYNQNAMNNAADLKQWMKNTGIYFFTDAVYFLPNYPISTHKASRLLALFRGALNREPTLAEFNSYLSQITNETSWNSLVSQFFNSSECNALLDIAIARANQGKPNYGWGNNPVINLVTNYPVVGNLPLNGSTINRATLQNALDNAALSTTNKIVLLSQMAVIKLNVPLNIPQGVTLATVGYPDRSEYAKMARIVWDTSVRTTNHMIIMNSGSSLLSVWVDGQVGSTYPRFLKNDPYSTIYVEGDRTLDSVQITDNRISDTFGCRSIWMGGHYYNDVYCRNNTISYAVPQNLDKKNR